MQIAGGAVDHSTVLRNLWCFVIVGCIVAVVVGETACGSYSRRLTVEVHTEPGVVCSDLHVPQPWEATAWKGFEFRGGDRLLVGVYYRKGQPELPTRYYSRYHYAAVRHDRGYALEPIGQGEWDAAQPLTPFSDFVFSGDNLGVQVGDRSFRYPGRLKLAAVMSRMRGVPDPIDSLAIGGYDGTLPTVGDLGMISIQSFGGRYSFDLYQTSTGRKYAAISGEYQNVNPANLLGRAFWINGPTFVLPLEESGLNRLLVCGLP